jgi:hypothetical protein
VGLEAIAPAVQDGEYDGFWHANSEYQGAVCFALLAVGQRATNPV